MHIAPTTTIDAKIQSFSEFMNKLYHINLHHYYLAQYGTQFHKLIIHKLQSRCCVCSKLTSDGNIMKAKNCILF